MRSCRRSLNDGGIAGHATCAARVASREDRERCPSHPAAGHPQSPQCDPHVGRNRDGHTDGQGLSCSIDLAVIAAPVSRAGRSSAVHARFIRQALRPACRRRWQRVVLPISTGQWRDRGKPSHRRRGRYQRPGGPLHQQLVQSFRPGLHPGTDRLKQPPVARPSSTNDAPSR